MKFCFKLILMLCILFFVGCTKVSYAKRLEQEINEKIETMTLKEKIGQMLIAYKEDSDISIEYLEELEKIQVGGFIIFDKNITTYEKTKKLISEINKVIDIPMLIAVDQEGGKVQRLLSVSDKKATNIPEMKKIGDKNDLNLSYALGTVIGEECRSLGINTVLGPVIDVGNYKTSALKNRLISNNPKIVSNNGLKIAEGINDTGVIPVFKHFPGIGTSKIDSHNELPVINKTIDELYQEELIPFIDSINNDYYQAEIIMVGHANYPKITNDKLPSSLSKKIVNELLRKELKFDGVVISDAINMKALTNEYSEEEIFELGINSSIDMFLMPSDITKAQEIIEGLVNSGKIDEEKINTSVKRILKLKNKYLINFSSIDELYFGSTEHKNIVTKIK